MLVRHKEAETLASPLPSMFSTREIVLANITVSDKKKEYIDQATKYLNELLESLNNIFCKEIHVNCL